MWQKVRPYIRTLHRLMQGINGFFYDIKRYAFYSGYKEDLFDSEIRSYQMVMTYHSLEKSLSYKKRNPTSGWKAAKKVLNLLLVAKKSGTITYHDKAGKQVLDKFLSLPENKETDQAKYFFEKLQSIDFASNDNHGAFEYSLHDFYKGKLENPEDFFYSRYSLREFKDEIVSKEVIERAVQLAMKTPSVCNRQSWHIYHTDNENVKKQIITFQGGNKPFGEHVPNYIVVTTDLKGFFTGKEHYQHWIDGGLLSMTLMYTLHSLGVASCPLNWSQTPQKDKAFRKAVNIDDSHTIIMVLAVGYPDETNIVCASARRPMQEIYSELKLRTK